MAHNKACICAVVAVAFLVMAVLGLSQGLRQNPFFGLSILVAAVAIFCLILVWPEAHFHRYAPQGKVRVIMQGGLTDSLPEQVLKDYDSPKEAGRNAWHDAYERSSTVYTLNLYDEEARFLGRYWGGAWDTSHSA